MIYHVSYTFQDGLSNPVGFRHIEADNPDLARFLLYLEFDFDLLPDDFDPSTIKILSVRTLADEQRQHVKAVHKRYFLQQKKIKRF